MADAQLPQEKFAEDLDELEEAITNLQVLYEKYFLGIDRRPPEQERLRVSRKMREMRTTMVRNTSATQRHSTIRHSEPRCGGAIPEFLPHRCFCGGQHWRRWEAASMNGISAAKTGTYGSGLSRRVRSA